MSTQLVVEGGIEHAESCLRNVVVIGRSLTRHAEKLHQELQLLALCGLGVDYVPPPHDDDSAEVRAEMRSRRAQSPAYLSRLHMFADGCARVDAELRVAVDLAHAALAAAAPGIDVYTVSAEDRTTVRVRRNLQELLRRTPSPLMAGWAQVAEPSVRQQIDEALGRVVADISVLQLIATTPSDTASKTGPIGGKRRRQVAGKPPLPQGPKLTKVDQAICLLSTPGHAWTVAELARHVGCTKQTLHGSDKFNRAWNGQQALAYVARGIKHDGQVEAVDEQGLSAADES